MPPAEVLPSELLPADVLAGDSFALEDDLEDFSFADSLPSPVWDGPFESSLPACDPPLDRPFLA